MRIDPEFRHPAVLLSAAALIGAASIIMVAVIRERKYEKALDLDRTQAAAELAQTRSQMRDIATRLDSLATAAAAAAQRATPAPAPAPRAAAPPPQLRMEDARLQAMQSQISRQQAELARTRDQIAQANQNLQGELNSTRENLQGQLKSTASELGGSIAKNHEELAALQKRGERNYYEFDLTKSKYLRQIGPVGLALRKTNTKHKNYNLDLLVEDNQLEKKEINIYEPVWINLSDRPQPVEIVVNFVGKDQVRGYVSEPKYKRSELATSTTPPTPPPMQLRTR